MHKMMNKQKFKQIYLIRNMKQSGNNFSINKFQLEDITTDKFNCDIKIINQTSEVNKTTGESKSFRYVFRV